MTVPVKSPYGFYALGFPDRRSSPCLSREMP